MYSIFLSYWNKISVQPMKIHTLKCCCSQTVHAVPGRDLTEVVFCHPYLHRYRSPTSFHQVLTSFIRRHILSPFLMSLAMSEILNPTVMRHSTPLTWLNTSWLLFLSTAHTIGYLQLVQLGCPGLFRWGSTRLHCRVRVPSFRFSVGTI